MSKLFHKRHISAIDTSNLAFDKHPSSAKNSQKILNRKKIQSGSQSTRNFYITEQNQPLLQKVRSRQSPFDQFLKPSLANTVIRDYIVPMFQEDTKQNFNRRRSVHLGKGSFDLSQHQRNREHLLSEKLNMLLQKNQGKLEQLKNELNNVLQEKDQFQQEIEFRKQIVQDSRCHLMMYQQYDQLIQNQIKRIPLEISLMNDKLSKYRAKFRQSEAHKNHQKKLLFEENQYSEESYNNQVQLNHSNSVYQLENKILGERLKGLFEANTELYGQQMTKNILDEQISIMQAQIQKLIQNEEDLGLDLFSLVQQQDNTKELNYQLSITRKSYLEEIHQKSSSTKDRIQHYKREIEQTILDRDHLKVEFTTLEKRYKELSEEYERTRAKLKQVIARQRTEDEEKLCKNCKREFLESQNFNWSCRTHLSPWSGKQYWCCGKTDEKAVGCQIGKHISRDDESENQEDSEQVISSTKNQFCTSCKQLGHLNTNCPSDPNNKSSIYYQEEINRLMDTIKNKQGESGLSGKAALGFTALLATRLKEEASQAQQIEQKPQKKHPFKDINKVRNGIDFDAGQNQFLIREMSTQDMKNELSVINRAKNISSLDLQSQHTPDATPSSLFLKKITNTIGKFSSMASESGNIPSNETLND